MNPLAMEDRCEAMAERAGDTFGWVYLCVLQKGHGGPHEWDIGQHTSVTPTEAPDSGEQLNRDELGLILFSRMVSRRPVWVDSPVGQMTWIQMIDLDDDGELLAYDHDGNDRRCDAYLLNDPKRSTSLNVDLLGVDEVPAQSCMVVAGEMDYRVAQIVRDGLEGTHA